MMDTVLLLGFYLLPALMIAAALSDVYRLKIPNGISLALFLTFPPMALAAGMPLEQFGIHVLMGLGALGLGFILFATRVMGAGDGKLFAVGVLWTGLDGFILNVGLMSAASFIMCLAVLGYRAYPMPVLPYSWFVRLHDPHHAVPFGVAIAAGAIGGISGSPWLLNLVL